MKKLFKLLLHPLLWWALAVAAVALLMWLVGPLLAIGTWRPLDTERARWIAIAALVAVVLAFHAWRAWSARRTNDRVVAQLVAAPAAASSNDPVSAELKVLDERFTQALAQLKGMTFANAPKGAAGVWVDVAGRLGKRHLYELPWYVIIGAPGSGKTTALLHSGLRFPLAASMGEQAVRGVGGTRNCDWWFTEEAVLLDTAGRYTTQTSAPDADAKAWDGFLGLLKKARPRQPLNGVLITVSVPDLLLQNAEQRRQQAAAVRHRVQELHQRLGVRLPMYLLVTKCDLLAGFTDYLGDVDKATRESPWGFTFPLNEQQHSDTSTFNAEFDLLEQRLHDGVIDRMQAEPDAQRRMRIHGFAQQFANVKGVLREFMDTAFSPSPYEAHPLLRGAYFVSGTQEGTPIDRMLGQVARQFGLSRDVVPSHQGTGKSFFLTRLLKEVVFAESGLGGTNLRWERRRGWMAMAGYAALAVVGSGTLWAWATSYRNNEQYTAQVQQNVAAAETLLRAVPTGTSSDVLGLLPVLDAPQALAQAAPDGALPWSLGFGLYQGRKLNTASQVAHQKLLVDGLLPRVAKRVEQHLRDGQNPDLAYEALKAHVMLHEPTRFNATALKSFVAADWEATLPRDTTNEQRASLEQHLDALLAQGPAISPLAQDKALVAQTRARLAATPLPERIYRRLKRQGVASEIPDFTIAQAAGAQAALVFRRASGASLTKGMPGLYTFDGYHKGLAKEVARVSDQLVDEEPWVLGLEANTKTDSTRSDPGRQQRVAQEVRRMYLTDYAQLWEAFVADIKIIPTSTLAQAVQSARVLSAPDNPLVPLLKALSKQTTLGAPSDGTLGKVESTAREVAQKTRDELAKVFGGAAPAAQAPGTRVEDIVDARFAALRQFVQAPEGQPAPVQGAVALLNEVYLALNATDAAVKGGNAPPPPDVQNKAKAEAARTPEPLRSMIGSLAVSGTTAALSATRTNLGQALNTQIGDFCRQAVNGRYPFVRSSTRDVTQEDFARLFAPGTGMFDDFFGKQLQPHVDTSTKPWSFRQQAGTSMGGPGTLVTFQKAKLISDTFFRAGGTAPGIRLDFKPVEMDASISQFTLDVDGQLVKYAHGPQIPTSIQWPGPRGSTQVRVQVSPPSASGGSGLVTEGPWALFRLLDRLQVEPGAAPERFRVIFNVDGRKAVFEVTTSSVRNPFRLRELEDFACPAKL
jgi:type VI secretion system protein ImpL